MTIQSTPNTPDYCTAEHPNAEFGCHGKPDHKGQHWCWVSTARDSSLCTEDSYYPFHYRFRWDDAPLEFTKAELKIILTLLQPVQQFFPELQAKIEKAVSK